ncbi:hypothetical protein CrV_gp066 [Cylindrospermopsis raciborskii virus RM-2018a]|nr:hypothetical protein CrV_gp066 [Cylindrospermopsis raciborskii virus RM-2018a]
MGLEGLLDKESRSRGRERVGKLGRWELVATLPEVDITVLSRERVGKLGRWEQVNKNL